MDASHGRAARAEATIARVAESQYGLFSRAQALSAGFTPRMITTRLSGLRWSKVDSSVYTSSTNPTSWEAELMAACLGGPAVASHGAAARLWALPGFSAAVREVTAYRHRRRKANAVIWHESRFLEEGRDTTTIVGIPVTSATRTIVDLSRVASVDAIEIALDNACHRGLTSLSRVGEEVERLRRRYGSDNIRSVLELKIADGDTLAESPLETRAAIILRNSGLPIPTPQFEIFDRSEFVGRADFAWPEQRVVLEVDGFAVHGVRETWNQDLRRRSRLAAAGWRVHHVTHADLAEPAVFVALLRKSLCVS